MKLLFAFLVTSMPLVAGAVCNPNEGMSAFNACMRYEQAQQMQEIYQQQQLQAMRQQTEQMQQRYSNASPYATYDPHQ